MREGKGCVHDGEALDDFRGGDDDACADGGEAELGEAEGVDDVLAPDGGDVVEHHVGEGLAVRVVYNEVDAAFGGHRGETAHFVVGDEVRGGIGGTGEAEGGDVFADFPETDAVFELMISEKLDARFPCGEHVFGDALAGVADVFGDEGEEDFFLEAAVGTCEHVEEEEVGGLAAEGDGDVAGVEVPPEGAV
jgi:hypothetical protein